MSATTWQRADTTWFREARWGVLCHYLAAPPSSSGEGNVTADEWNRLVDGFDVDGLAVQLSNVGVPYFFLTLGQNTGHYCSPNATYDALVPRRSARVVVVDEDGGALAHKAAYRLFDFGYKNIALLQGGVRGWQQAGYEVFSGVYVPSKAFGEFVEHRQDTPRIEPRELKAKIDAGEKVVILDSRPMEERSEERRVGKECRSRWSPYH